MTDLDKGIMYLLRFIWDEFPDEYDAFAEDAEYIHIPSGRKDSDD